MQNFGRLCLQTVCKQAEIFLFIVVFSFKANPCASATAARAPGCRASPCHHFVRLLPSITRCHFTPCPTATEEWRLPGLDFVTNLDCILCSSAFCLQGQKPLLLALYIRQPSLTQMGFPTGINRDAKSKLFSLCESPWNASKYFCAICSDQGDRLGKLKTFVRCFLQNISFHLALKNL